MTINPKVIDISHYDGVAGGGFQLARRFGIVGVIHKSSEGLGIVDSRYATRRASAVAAGMLWGCYHFIRSGNMKNQAEFFLRAASSNDKTLVSLDYEVDNVNPSAAREFIELVESKIGRKVVLYSGNTIKEKLGSRHDPWWAERRLWLAQYATKWTVQASWRAPWLWQYTGDGVGPGPHNVPGIIISGGCDISSYAGNDEQLRAQWVDDSSHVPVPAPVPLPPPVPVPSPKQFTHIMASEFGGSGDAQSSAYGGNVDPNKPGVALPARFVGARPKVRVALNGRTHDCFIVDVGPWFTNDPYWMHDERPRAENNRGVNKAGIDLTPNVWKALGAPGRGLDTLDYWEFI